MIISNRRDAGYTIISRFEEAFRSLLIEYLTLQDEEFFNLIPQGIILKANERGNCVEWEDLSEFMDNIDFPDLTEITLFKQNAKIVLKEKLTKEHFKECMKVLYDLRCKIAHIKGFFTSIDLDALIELTSKLSVLFQNEDFKKLIDKINRNPHEVIITIPPDFVEDFYESNGITHNLPTPDYEYEGGFVGRDDDKKKIKQYLKSEKFSVVTITGAGGVGKTSIALKVINEISQNGAWFDSILWLSAKENKLSPLGIEDIEPTLKSYEELLDTFISLFDFTSEITENTVEEKESLTELIIDCSNQILVVIDNLETITDDRIINFIIDAPAKVKFLVTSRKGIGQVERRYELKQLKSTEAVYLFRQLARDKQLESLIKLENEVIKKYVAKVSYYPLAIKWVIGQVARGKDINAVIDTIHNDESDISKFCFEQIFDSISDKCKRVLYTVSLMESAPTRSILQHISELDEKEFEDAIEELILVSLIIPEQFQDESKEIGTKYNLLPLTKGYTRLQLNKNIDLRECLKSRIIEIESTVSESLRAQKEYKHSLYNFGAKSDEEKIATIIAQNAFQKYQSGTYDEAVEEYKRAVKTAPKFAPVYRNWGVMESYENHVTEATSLMERASELDPKDPQIFLLWGNIYRKNGKFTDAHSKYETAFNLAPKDPIVLNAFGQAKSRLGLFEEADKLLQESNRLSSEFNSIKHTIITKTSLAENLINWGDLLTRDKNFGLAKVKYNDAINYCMDAINDNARDSKIYTALTKAHLKKAHLLLQMRKDTEALQCYYNIVNSNDETFKHSLIKLTALIDLSEYHYKKGNVKQGDIYFNQISSGSKYSPILRQIKYQQLNDRYRHLKLNMVSENNSLGVIKRASPEHGYVIIEDKETNDTYIGGANDFLPRLSSIDTTFVGLSVNYQQKVYEKDGKTKRQAQYIKITGANNV